jgi:hypothetical protein
LYSDILQRTSSVESSSKLRDDIWELASELRVLSSRFGGLKGGE